jgi:hypothetical protein
MHAWDIVGYAFDGALYCPRHVPQAHETKCECRDIDKHGACMSNCHGYGPDPVFASDATPGDACDVDGCGYLDGCEPEEEVEEEEEEEEEEDE